MPHLNLETRKQVIVLLRAGYSIQEIYGRLEDEGVMFKLHKNSQFVNRGIVSHLIHITDRWLDSLMVGTINSLQVYQALYSKCFCN